MNNKINYSQKLNKSYQDPIFNLSLYNKKDNKKEQILFNHKSSLEGL